MSAAPTSQKELSVTFVNLDATEAELEIIHLTSDEWVYDLRTDQRHITPREPMATRQEALNHATEAAHKYGYRIISIEAAGE
jgi:hypothetical protein